MRNRRLVTSVVGILMAGFVGSFDGAGTTRLLALPDLCPIAQACEVYASGCRTSHQGCSLTDSGLQECQLAPGQTFSCNGNHTIHVKTCPCTGTCGGQASGTELVCA